MAKWITGLFLAALAIGLSIFTGSRTIDLLSWALPAGQQIYAWLALAAFEGGMYLWSFYFIAGAKGTPQRSISAIMAALSMIAVAVCTIADLNIDAAQQGKVAQLTATEAQAVIDFVGGVIVLNVIAFLCCKLFSIDNLRRIKEQAAEDLIHNAGLTAIEALAPSIANDAAPHLATEWANRTWDRMVPGIPHQTYYLPQRQQPQQALEVQEKSIDATPAHVNKKGWLDKAKGFLPGGKKEELPVYNTPKQQDPKEVNERYQQMMKEIRAEKQSRVLVPARSSHIAAARRARREQRYARPVNKPEKVTVQPPLESVALAQTGVQGDGKPMKNTPARGSSTRKQGNAPGKTSGSSKGTHPNKK